MVTKANIESVREAIERGDTTLTLEKVLKEAGLVAKWEAKAKARGKAQAREELTKEMTIRALEQGFAEETIAS
ncbi:MAG: hypothetical protein LBK13_07910, partial [Spirochaetales bacterium]|nr:hypothetical protein [Spirochaetales bacterium]